MITPTQFAELSTLPYTDSQLSQCEELFDDGIKEASERGSSDVLIFADPEYGVIPGAAVAVIATRYRDAGWTVTVSPTDSHWGSAIALLRAP